MKSNLVTKEEHGILLRTKYDASWERYFGGWIDVVDRYNVTVSLTKGPRVLDIGCGEGLLGHLLADKKGIETITGVDACEEMVFVAMSHVGAFVELYATEAEDMPFERNKFDTVVLGQVLEHVIDVDKVVNESLRVLKPGGRLIVNVPCDDIEPHGNHLHVFDSLQELLEIFPGITWEGEGILHRFYFAWGMK